ncbi:NUDIX domain-containing protein [Halorubrum xinjiangense]|uniref:NUDIX domain-containing protein n=1 Tax=Halorubrum xinjiangense TaxID=261291 RepID=A0A1G7KVT6_9EURY|nr:NUDIX domain-containing protein [Halorubrum xinjiangense]SDF41030.1 NUDIX domain-containing protein [Halorubrum xinjiangense]
MREIRVVTLGAVRRGEELLVQAVGRNDAGGRNFRLLGGGVEFGEHSEDALRREFDEELGVALDDVSPLGTYERVFDHEERRHHEVWRVYEATIVEDWPYDREAFSFVEPDSGAELRATWKRPRAFRSGPDHLYGETLLDDLGPDPHSAQ